MLRPSAAFGDSVEAFETFLGAHTSPDATRLELAAVAAREVPGWDDMFFPILMVAVPELGGGNRCLLGEAQTSRPHEGLGGNPDDPPGVAPKPAQAMTASTRPGNFGTHWGQQRGCWDAGSSRVALPPKAEFLDNLIEAPRLENGLLTNEVEFHVVLVVSGRNPGFRRSDEDSSAYEKDTSLEFRYRHDHKAKWYKEGQRVLATRVRGQPRPPGTTTRRKGWGDSGSGGWGKKWS